MKYVVRLTSLTSLLLALLSGACLFWVSQQVQQVEREQRGLVAQNLQEEESIRVLKTEWDYLNRPERLEELSTKYLNMAPVSADTLIQSISAIPEPEDSTAAPEEYPIPVSTAIARNTITAAPTIHLEPPVLSERDAARETGFGQVLDTDDGGGQ